MKRIWLIVLVILLLISPVVAERGGRGKHMGWLKTPDFKNPGFEEGDLSHWTTTGTATREWFQPLNKASWANSGDYSAECIVSAADVDGGDKFISQDVNFTGATGIKFSVKVHYYMNTWGSTEYIRVYVAGDKLYEEEVTDHEHSYRDIYVPATYRGIQTASIGVMIDGKPTSGNVVSFDDIHLVGPGF